MWLLVFFLYKQKNRFTLIPFYTLLAVFTFITHNFSDLGFVIAFQQFHFFISSIVFFTSLMLGVLILYLFEGPRAARLALWIILATSFFYIGLVYISNYLVLNNTWIHFSAESLRYYFWSILAIVLDIFFLTIVWEILERVKKIPLLLRIFIVALGTYSLDSLIFVSGLYLNQSAYFSILLSNLTIRLVLSIITSIVVRWYLYEENYQIENRKKPAKIWEILNFKSDLELEIKSLSQSIKQEQDLSTQLNKIKETYALAIEGVGAGIWDLDIVHDKVTFTPKFAQLLGYEFKELPTTAAQMRALIHQADAKFAASLILNDPRQQKTFSTEYRLRLKNGQYRWFQNSGIIKYNAKGKTIRMVGSIVDIDEKKRLSELNQQQAEELKKFKLAVEAASDQIVITDAEGLVLYANPMTSVLTGYQLKEALGTKAGKLWGDLMPREYYKKLWDTIKIDKKTFVNELTNKRKNGVLYDALIKVSPILDEQNNVKFFVAIERDISQEKQLAKMKDEFLSVASHELRTPLTAIDGLIAMIREGEYGKVNKELQQPLADVNLASERLINLVNDLLSVSRIEAGRLKYNLTDCHVKNGINEVIRFLEVVAKEKGLTLKAGKIPDVSIQADKDKVRQILNNLIGNSLKFTDKGGITITAKEEGELLIIKVSDTGIGIKKEDQQKLFQKFEQLDSGKGRPAGTGLGLFISKQMCQKMGGDLWLAKSEFGKGSTFAFSMPKTGSKTAKQSAELINQEALSNPNQKADLIVHN